VIVAIARGREVGVDVERVRFPLPELAGVRRYLAPGERAAIDAREGLAQAEAFFRAWTRKEALLKATGEGIGGLGPGLDLSSGSDFYRYGRSWHVTDVNLRPGYAIALAIEGEACAIRPCPWHP
jgi:4'-phosphopantetheinyl transferase